MIRSLLANTTKVGKARIFMDATMSLEWYAYSSGALLSLDYIIHLTVNLILEPLETQHAGICQTERRRLGLLFGRARSNLQKPQGPQRQLGGTYPTTPCQ